MPPSTLDLVRTKITRLLNVGRYPEAALDDGHKITYTVEGRTFEITVKEVST